MEPATRLGYHFGEISFFIKTNIMKTKYLFSAVLFAMIAFAVQAQDILAATDSGVKVTTVKEGSGPTVTKGQDFEMHAVYKSQDGKVQFDSRKMGVAIHDVLGKGDGSKLSDAIHNDVLSRMQKGDVVSVFVPKSMLDANDPASKLEGDHVTIEIELVDFADAAPNAADLVESTIKAAGTDAGKAVFDGLRDENREGYKFYEWDFNRLGYQFLQAKNVDAAVEVFKMNTAMYPESANTYDSLGDAYVAAGDTHEAIICFERALELNPDFSSSKEKLEELKK